MAELGKKSMERLLECDPKLQKICLELIKHFDFAVVCGHRGQADQDAAFASGASKQKWPSSKHNSTPSRAVDIVPYIAELPEPYRLLIGTEAQIKGLAAFYKITTARATEIMMKHYDQLDGAFLVIAAQFGIPVRSGANWDGDQNLYDQLGKLSDAPHKELL